MLTEPFDWQEQHERFAEELSGSGSFYDCRQNGHSGNRTCESEFETTDKNYITQEVGITDNNYIPQEVDITDKHYSSSEKNPYKSQELGITD